MTVNIRGLSRRMWVETAFGSNGAGGVIVPGAVVGDKVGAVYRITDGTSQAASFETTVTVANQVQQSSASNLSAMEFDICIEPQI